MRRCYPTAPIAAVGAVVIDAESVLLVRRSQEPLLGAWSLPGGAVELGETLERAVTREVLEETGLGVEPVLVAEVLDRITYDERGQVRYHYVLVDYLCRVTGGTVQCGTDAAEAVWVSREQLEHGSSYGLEKKTSEVIDKAFQLARG